MESEKEMEGEWFDSQNLGTPFSKAALFANYNPNQSPSENPLYCRLLISRHFYGDIASHHQSIEIIPRW
jgi:hypothetical protein